MVDVLGDSYFDYELARARMLGHDVATMLDEAGARRISDLLAEQTDLEGVTISAGRREPNPAQKGAVAVQSQARRTFCKQSQAMDLERETPVFA